jgi:hypothetical protein
MQQLSDDLAKAGLDSFPAPCGILLDEGKMPFSTCVRCQNCDGFPCVVHAKSDAEVIAVRPAIENPNVTLLIGAEAVRLQTNDAGTAATGVVVTLDRHNETFHGAIVVVGDKHPRGLANSSDQLGRNYMFHHSAAVLAISKKRTRLSSRRPSASTTCISRAVRTSSSRWGTSRWSASRRRRCHGEKPGETRFAPPGRSRTSPKHAVDFCCQPRISRSPATASRSPGTATS